MTPPVETIECSIPEHLTIAEYRAGRRSSNPHVNNYCAAFIAWLRNR